LGKDSEKIERCCTNLLRFFFWEEFQVPSNISPKSWTKKIQERIQSRFNFSHLLVVLVFSAVLYFAWLWFTKERQPGGALFNLSIETLLFSGSGLFFLLILIYLVPLWQINSKEFISEDKALPISDNLRV
jgi:hypothetical protein